MRPTQKPVDSEKKKHFSHCAVTRLLRTSTNLAPEFQASNINGDLYASIYVNNKIKKRKKNRTNHYSSQYKFHKHKGRLRIYPPAKPSNRTTEANVGET